MVLGLENNFLVRETSLRRFCRLCVLTGCFRDSHVKSDRGFYHQIQRTQGELTLLVDV